MGELMKLDEPSNLPAYLANFNTGIGTAMLIGGMSGNRIGLKGSRFRLIINGQEEGIVEESFLDVIIVGASPSPGVARMYYEQYDADVKSAPLCFSADGITPAADVRAKQHDKCATCPQNVKGSRTTANGEKTKACGYFKRLAVALPSDLNTVYRLDCKSMSIFGEGNAAANQFTLGEYGKKLGARHVDPGTLITRLRFDTESSVPKLYFSPVKFISKEDISKVIELVNREDTKAMLEITASTVDLSQEKDATETAETETPAEPAPEKPAGPTIVRKAAAAAPAAAKTAPASAPAVSKGPTVTRAAAPAAKPTVTRAPAPAASDPGDDPDLAAMLAKLENE